jgi:hypothetical protein
LRPSHAATIDVAARVKVEHHVHRLGTRLGADRHEHASCRDAIDASIVAVAQLGVLEARRQGVCSPPASGER